MSSAYLYSLLAESLGDLFFGEVHWLLVIFYWKIAKNTPKVLEGRQDEV